MERSERRSFTDGYKRQAVDLVASSGRSIEQIHTRKPSLLYGSRFSCKKVSEAF